jgi:hypothetical protein
LKEVLHDLIPKEQKRVAAFKAANKDAPLGQVTVDMVKTNTFFPTACFIIHLLDLWWYAWY